LNNSHDAIVLFLIPNHQSLFPNHGTIENVFVFLSKLLPQFIYPLGLMVVLLILALVFQRRRNWQMGILLLALAIVWIAGNSWVASALARSLEWQYLPPAELPTVDAIVILGGGTDPQIYPRQTPELNGAGDRVFYGAYLYKQGKAPKILLSGGRIDWLDLSTSAPADEMADILMLMGIPEEGLIREDRSLNTYENAVYSAEILREMDIHQVLLVTSAMHMPRSVGLFQHQGIDVIPAPTDFKVTQNDRDAGWQSVLINLFPDVSSLNQTSAVIKEYIGILVYRMRGWM
jgi:uncharacterized SAM-binding protein YcdF (DUF218 family)